MGKFKKAEVVAAAFCVPYEITIDAPTPIVIRKNDWLCVYDDGHLEGWTNNEFRKQWVPLDADANRELE